MFAITANLIHEMLEKLIMNFIMKTSEILAAIY